MHTRARAWPRRAQAGAAGAVAELSQLYRVLFDVTRKGNNQSMTWLAMLGLAGALIAVAAVLGAQPRGGRPVANTNLMGVARVVLFVCGLILAYFAFRARGH